MKQEGSGQRAVGNSRQGDARPSSPVRPTPLVPQPLRKDVEAAIAALRDADAAAREGALRWLGEHAPGALTADYAWLLRDPALVVRAAAATVFRSSSDPALVDGARLALRDLLLGSDTEARHAGLRAAAVLANPTLMPRLLPFLKDPDPETRRLTLLALAAAEYPGLLPPEFLVAPARAALGDPDAGVRQAARTLLERLRPHLAENEAAATPAPDTVD